MDYTKIFETDRFVLRKCTIDDAEDIFNYYASRDKVTEYLSWNTHTKKTIIFIDKRLFIL